ncbi:hypothetical protein FA15DRAFT_654692 [Coprinopsis marcescibilis]|nr:hypothetical protein FA15DRAFT_654692 [Coprinopsis marcescibilis]
MKNMANISEILLSEDIARYTSHKYFIQKFGRTKTFETQKEWWTRCDGISQTRGFRRYYDPSWIVNAPYLRSFHCAHAQIPITFFSGIPLAKGCSPIRRHSAQSPEGSPDQFEGETAAGSRNEGEGVHELRHSWQTLEPTPWGLRAKTAGVRAFSQTAGKELSRNNQKAQTFQLYHIQQVEVDWGHRPIGGLSL